MSAMWVTTVLGMVAGALMLLVAARPLADEDCIAPIESSLVVECTELYGD